jgi:hypothetical protein
MKSENSKETQQFERKYSLTKLCVLSFIGIALWIARDIKMYFDYLAMDGVLNKESFLVGIALNILILFGVVLMWKLKKIGFYIYSLLQIVWIVIPLIVGTWVDTYFGFLILPAIICTPIFITMYGLNLKHMSR